MGAEFDISGHIPLDREDDDPQPNESPDDADVTDVDTAVIRQHYDDAADALAPLATVDGHPTPLMFDRHGWYTDAPETDVDVALEKVEAGERFRGAWWRKVVKPGLEALDDVQNPSRGGSEWSPVGE